MCEVRSIPIGGGGGGGLCEEAVYEEYNGLRQTRKGHEKCLRKVGLCVLSVCVHGQ